MSDEVHGRMEFLSRMALEIAGVGVGIRPAGANAVGETCYRLDLMAFAASSTSQLRETTPRRTLHGR